MNFFLRGFLALLVVSVGFSPIAQAALNPDLPWHEGNREVLDQMISVFQQTPDTRKVAVFDLDGTIIRGDLGDTLLFYMLRNNLVVAPLDWKLTSPYLSRNALKKLKRTCSSQSGILRTAGEENQRCAELITSIYADLKTPDGKAAWIKNSNPETIDPAYAWAVTLTGQHTPEEIRTFTRKALYENIARPMGSTIQVGEQERVGWLRVFPQMRNLIAELQAAGTEVWICSATVQFAVEAIADLLGIPRHRVIGVRPELTLEGRISRGFQSCGHHPSGNQSLITFREGKKCWINQVIFGLQDPQEMALRPVEIQFGAGDSDSDFSFLNDSTFRLVLNRNKSMLMCHAYANADGNWLINPQFLLPLPKKEEGYPCNEWGLPHVQDTIFGTHHNTLLEPEYLAIETLLDLGKLKDLHPKIPSAFQKKAEGIDFKQALQTLQSSSE